MRLCLKADVERYGSIAERWPTEITVSGTVEQIKYFLTNGIYEAGCDDLYVSADTLSEVEL